MSHQPHDIFENRNQFQLERMILFSDAVFAIAITLLIIEIKIPEIHEHETLLQALDNSGTLNSIISLVVSFAIIGQFWTNHHRLFGYVTNYDGGLLWVNLHMLFWVILMPFSTALSTHYGRSPAVWGLYCFNMFMIGISIYFLWRYITNPKRKLSWIANDPVISKMARARSFAISCIFLLGTLLVIVFPDSENIFWAAHFIFFLIFPAIVIIKRKYQPKKITPLKKQG
ncbi:MAG: TMEM175 family protein [Bacteroidota bacterium]